LKKRRGGPQASKGSKVKEEGNGSGGERSISNTISSTIILLGDRTKIS